MDTKKTRPLIFSLLPPPNAVATVAQGRLSALASCCSLLFSSTYVTFCFLLDDESGVLFLFLLLLLLLLFESDKLVVWTHSRQYLPLYLLRNVDCPDTILELVHTVLSTPMIGLAADVVAFIPIDTSRR